MENEKKRKKYGAVLVLALCLIALTGTAYAVFLMNADSHDNDSEPEAIIVKQSVQNPLSVSLCYDETKGEGGSTFILRKDNCNATLAELTLTLSNRTKSPLDLSQYGVLNLVHAKATETDGRDPMPTTALEGLVFNIIYENGGDHIRFTDLRFGPDGRLVSGNTDITQGFAIASKTAVEFTVTLNTENWNPHLDGNPGDYEWDSMFSLTFDVSKPELCFEEGYNATYTYRFVTVNNGATVFAVLNGNTLNFTLGSAEGPVMTQATLVDGYQLTDVKGWEKASENTWKVQAFGDMSVILVTAPVHGATTGGI